MTIDQLRQVHGTRPFAPFSLHLADGRALHVPHPEFLWIPPQASRTVHVAVGKDRVAYADVLLVTSIAVGNGKTRRRGRAVTRFLP